LLKTTAEKDEMRINFLDSKGSRAGGFVLDPSKSKYGFPLCTNFSSATEELKTSLPEPDNAGYRIFTIEAYGEKGQGLKISCNGKVLISFEPSNKACSGWYRWENYWHKKKEKLDFKFDSAISYYAKVPFEQCKKVNSSWKHVTTVPELPVEHGTIVSLRCTVRTVNRGGSGGVCEDGVIVASKSNPILCEGKLLTKE
jgi:hypothetical protein